MKSSLSASVVLALCLSASAMAQAPARLVKDINATLSAAGSDPGDFLTIGETTYFSAELEQRGRGVWKTDGTTAGTVLVQGFRRPDIAGGEFYQSRGHAVLHAHYFIAVPSVVHSYH